MATTTTKSKSSKIVSVASANLAIGRVVKRYPSNTTRIEVEIVSSITHGGPQAKVTVPE